MKVIALLIVKNEADILPQMLDHAATWVDGVVALDNGSTDGTLDILVNHPIVLTYAEDPYPFHEGRMTISLINLAERFGADWYVDNDADEFFPVETRKVLEEDVCLHTTIVTVNIHSLLNDRCYDIKPNWRRIYKNRPDEFDFSLLKKLHGGKIPLKPIEHRTFSTPLVVQHKSIRSYEQGMRKYENYKRIDTEGIQKSYEHIRVMAEALKTGDFTGIQWVS